MKCGVDKLSNANISKLLFVKIEQGGTELATGQQEELLINKTLCCLSQKFSSRTGRNRVSPRWWLWWYIVVCMCCLQCNAGLLTTPSVDHVEHTIQRR